MPRWPKDKAEYDAQWVASVMAKTRRDEKTGCLLWTGCLDTCGYADRSYRGKGGNVHRRLYQIVKGVTLTDEQKCCHRCDVRNCIELDHIFIGTMKDNQRDMANKGRANGQWKTHCKRGHPLSGDNLYLQPYNKAGGVRACKACQRGRHRIKGGWPEDLAYSMDAVPAGQRPVNAKGFAKQFRSKHRAKNRNAVPADTAANAQVRLDGDLG